ncbi:MAG: AAA family ATPase [Pseudomonadota bacterium]
MIFGQPGSGKSTFAVKLGEATGLPVFHWDQLRWQSGEDTDREDWERICREVYAESRWIFEGAPWFGGTDQLSLADTVIGLDRGIYPRMLRVTLRTLRHYGHTRPGAPELWKEGLGWKRYQRLWRSRQRAQILIENLLATVPEGPSVYHFKSDRETEAFIDACRA